MKQWLVDVWSIKVGSLRMIVIMIVIMIIMMMMMMMMMMIHEDKDGEPTTTKYQISTPSIIKIWLYYPLR